MTLRVRPGARRDRIVGPHGGALKVEVTAPPERGRANEAVIRLLARTLGVPRAAVEIVSGASGRDKSVRIHGVAPDAVRAALEAAGVRAGPA